MGYRFAEPDRSNPKGFWEDLDFVDHNKRLIEGQVSISRFIHKIRKTIKYKNRQDKWGVKDPRIGDLLGLYVPLLPTCRAVWARRSYNLTTKSMGRCYGISRSRASYIYRRRYRTIHSLVGLLDYITLDFDRNLTDQEVQDTITERWGDV